MARNECSKRKRGGQPGNKNAVKHGFYTKTGKERFQQVDDLVRDCHALLKAISGQKDTDVSDVNLNIFSRS